MINKYIKKIIFISFVFLFYISLSIFTENIPISDGLGWDGQLYGELAVDFENLITSGEVPKFKLLKIVPSAICYYALPLLGREHNFQNVILFFKVFNAISMTFAFFYWLGICKFLKFDTKQTILGTTFCFVNFIFVKYYSFYPVLTDFFAYALAMAGLYHWFKGQTIRLVIVVLLSAWTWTQLTYPLFFLLIFPHENNITYKSCLINNILKSKLKSYVIPLLSLLIGCILTYNYWVSNESINQIYLIISLFEISLILNLGLSLSLISIIKRIRNDGFISFSKIGILLSATVYLLIHVSTIIVDVPDIELKEYNTFLTFFYRSFKFPLISTLSHIVLLSPILLVVLLYYKKTIRPSKDIGIGFSLYLLFNLVFLFNSETRHMIHAFPLYVILFLKVFKMNNIHTVCFIILQITLSFFYFKFNTSEGFNKEFFLTFFGFSMLSDYYLYILFTGVSSFSLSYLLIRKNKSKLLNLNSFKV
jgi:hypothetical protein